MTQIYPQTKRQKRKFAPFVFFAFMALCLSLGKANAQAPTISYPTAAQDLTRGYNQSLLTVKLVFNGVCTGTVRLGLPDAVTYVAGSVTKTSGTAAVSIAEASIADLSKPTFNITGVATIGDEITFTVARRAGCGSLATAKDSVYFVAGAGCSDGSEVAGAVNKYNLFAPALSITPPAALTGTVIGTTANRTAVVTNGGNGALDTLRYYVVYPSAGIVNTSGTNAITANSVSFTPSSTSGDTLFYKIFGATIFGGDNLLTTGETVNIIEPIRVAKCNTTTTYAARWGRNVGEICQTASATSSITMATGVANATGTNTTVQTVSTCQIGIYNFTYSNSGSGGLAGAMYNVIANVGFTNGSTPVLVNRTLSGTTLVVDSVKLGSLSLIFTAPGSGGTNPWQIDLSQFATDPDGVGIGLDDLDGDGQYDDLAPGKSFTLTVYDEWVKNNSCPHIYMAQGISTYVRFSEMCGTVATTGNLFNIVDYYFFASIPASQIIPSQINGGEVFTYKYCVSKNLVPSTYRPSDTTYFRLSLPSGVSYQGNPKLNGVAIAASAVRILSGTLGAVDTLLIALKGVSNSACYEFDLEYTCSGSSASLTFNSELDYLHDISCGFLMRLQCRSATIEAVCTAPCSTGIRNDANLVNRLTLGYTDATLSTKVSPSVLTKVAASTFLPLDSVQITSTGLQFGTYNNLYYDFKINKTSSSESLLSFVEGTLFVKNGVSSTVTSCAIPSYSDLSTSTIQNYNWNLSSCLPSSSITAGDSVWVILKFVVTRAGNDNLLGGTLTKASSSGNFYNLNATSGKDFCNFRLLDLYFNGKLSLFGVSPSVRTFGGCGGGGLAVTKYYSHQNSSDIFPNEYRPYLTTDSFKVTIPTGYRFDPSVTPTFSRSFYVSEYVLGALTQSTTFSVSGNVVTIKSDGTWLPSDFANNVALTFRIIPNCSAPSITTSGIVESYGKMFAYAPTPIDTIISAGLGTSNYSVTTKPSVTIANNTGTVQGVNVNQHWDVQINSLGTTTAPYVWMALEQGLGSGNITVDSVKLLPSGTLISPTSTYNTNDKWYQISTVGLASSTSQQARVFFRYTSCSPDSVQVKTGWNCSGYPSPNPQADTNACAVATYLKVDPLASQVQLSVLRQPGGGSSINLCTVDSALIVLNSAQAANLVSPYVTFFPPVGLSLVTPIKVEYPRGSGDYQNATVTSLPGGGYKIDLSAHTAIGTNGMLGTANASPAYVPLGGDREAKIKVDFTTDCSYTSGTSFTFRGYGSKPCGEAAIDNGIAATTSALDITGATAAGGAGVTISFGGAASTVGCGSTAVTLSLITTPTTFGTTAGDTMTYTLPIGMGYAGNLTAGYSAVVTGGGGAPTIVKIAMPTGVAASTPINFNFDVEPRGGGCGAVNITGAYQRRIAALLCSGVPCASSSVVISTATSPNITLVKPSLVISNIAILDTTAWRQANYAANHIKVFYTNNGTQALTANVDTVEFFCNSTATVPFAKRPLTKNIAIGASDSDEYYIMMPIGACTLGDVITAKIQTTTAGGTAQCLCAPSQYVAAGIGLPLAFLTTNAQVNNCAVSLSWSYNNSANVANFEIERSNNGANYSSIATLKAATENYVDVTPNSGKWFYRIKAKSLEGSLAYSQTITATTSQCVGNSVTIYPNPASEQLQIVLQGASSNNEYQMVDALGRVVLRGNLQANTNNKVDVSAVAQGVYVIKIISDGNVSTQQVQIRK